MLFIYWLENNPQFAKRVVAIRTRMEERGDQLITGAFTFGEVLAGPYRIGAVKVADEAKRLLRSVVSELVPFTIDTADHYARIRATLGLPPADAIHLASASWYGPFPNQRQEPHGQGRTWHSIHCVARHTTLLKIGRGIR